MQPLSVFIQSCIQAKMLTHSGDMLVFVDMNNLMVYFTMLSE